MKHIKIYISLIAAVLFFAQCQKSEEIGKTRTGDLAGEWWANLYADGQALYASPHKIFTYNVSADVDSMWVDDDGGNLWNFLVKAGCNTTDLTFSTKDAKNSNYDPAHPANAPLTVTITDGKVFPMVGHSKTGNLTDSIYMKIIFSDDPETTYEIKGTATTNRDEDNY